MSVMGKSLTYSSKSMEEICVVEDFCNCANESGAPLSQPPKGHSNLAK